MIINIHRPGRMGNQLIQHSHLLCYCREYNLNFINLAFFEYNENFEGTQGYKTPRNFLLNNKFDKFIPRKLSITFCNNAIKWLSKLMNGKYLFQYIRLYQIKNVDLSHDLGSAGINKITVTNGWIFTDNKSLVKHIDFIRLYFKPKQEILDAVKMMIPKRKENEILIGCHIRRGDYRSFCNGKYFYTDIEYNNFLDHTSSLFPNHNIRFLLCSDEKINYNSFSNFNFIIGSKQGVVDMYALSCCDYIMGPPSTFAAWASLYGKVPRYIIEENNIEFTLDNFKKYEDEIKQRIDPEVTSKI